MLDTAIEAKEEPDLKPQTQWWSAMRMNHLFFLPNLVALRRLCECCHNGTITKTNVLRSSDNQSFNLIFGNYRV